VTDLKIAAKIVDVEITDLDSSTPAVSENLPLVSREQESRVPLESSNADQKYSVFRKTFHIPSAWG
jgi:hypothetical protein